MANLVSHVVAVSGAPEGVEAFRRRLFGADKRRPAPDFAALVPMPEIVRGAGGSSEVTDGLIILGEDEVPDQFGKTAGEQAVLMLDYPWVREAGVGDRAGLVELLTRRAKQTGRLEASLDGARRALRAYRETGHASEQSWAIQHWGVRGNPESFEILKDEPGLLEFSFATAWSTPEAIWDRIAEAFPDLVVTVAGFEEAWHFAVVGEIAGGANRLKETEPTPELYERVFGEPYGDEEDDDDASPQRFMTDEEFREFTRETARKSLEQWRSSMPPEQTGWRKYKWDLLGWLIGAVIAAVYLLLE